MKSTGNESTRRKLRRAPTPVLERTKTVYGWVGRVAYLSTGALVLLGIWLDWRWLATALLTGFAWCVAHMLDDLIEEELERRGGEVTE